MVFVSISSTACARSNSSRPPLSPAALAKCASRGSPITLGHLVRVFRSHGISLSIEEKTCLATAKERSDAGRPDATNGGPSGLQISKQVKRREGFVLCSLFRRGFGRTVVVKKYATDQETGLSVLNIYCAVYPFSPATEKSQVERVRRALAALVRK